MEVDVLVVAFEARLSIDHLNEPPDLADVDDLAVVPVDEDDKLDLGECPLLLLVAITPVLFCDREAWDGCTSFELNDLLCSSCDTEADGRDNAS